ncbi:MAG: GIY-YIG nuclease family protein [Thermodesulfobacteriota bacterium]
MNSPAAWFVYILRCRDGSLYTGITTDLARRLAEHNAGRAGARYTRSRRPVTLAYAEPAASRSAAARREFELKQLPPAAKRALIARPALYGSR